MTDEERRKRIMTLTPIPPPFSAGSLATMPKKAKGEKKISAAQEVVTREYTVHLRKLLHGIGFTESSIVQVKFSDGKRDATVPGKFISPTQVGPCAPYSPRTLGDRGA